MTVSLSTQGVRAVLLDIEGTTTPMAFVHDVLFPFARERLGAWCRHFRASPEYAEVIDHLSAEHRSDTDRGEPVPPWRDDTPAERDASMQAYVRWLMDRDRKSPPLKRLQGLIWEAGYRAGELAGQVYDDVPAAIRRWHAAGRRVAIYSSGSELAQRRLFESTGHGDLTPLIDRFFDTGVGAKGESGSYRRISATLGCEPRDLLFVSDVTAELAAAEGAGCQTVLSVRPGNREQRDAGRFVAVQSFDEIA